MSTMSIRINPGNLRTSEAITAYVERRVRSSLRHLSPRITRVEVHFADLNGPKEGKADMRCVMEARLNRRKPLSVEHRAENLYTAIDGASRKLRAAVGRAVGRVAAREQRRARADANPPKRPDPPDPAGEPEDRPGRRAEPAPRTRARRTCGPAKHSDLPSRR